jgi:transposase
LLPKEAVIDYYNQFWKVERTFSITKRDLSILPIFHNKDRRIKAHICIVFAASKVYKELEKLLKLKKAGISAVKAIEILKTLYGLIIQLPQSKKLKLMLLDTTDEQILILRLFV